MGGSYNDHIGSFKIFDDSTAYISGHFFNAIDLDLSDGVSNLYASPPEDIFIDKYTDFDINDFTIASVQEPELNPSGIVYPNPTDSYVFIKMDTSSIEKVSILTITGQAVLIINKYDGDPVNMRSLSADYI